MAETFESIAQWQDETFPHMTVQSFFAHLEKEVTRELLTAVRHRHEPGIREETADCVLLLIGLARTAGFDLWEAVEEKMVINRQRTWGEPNEQGFVEHVKEATNG